MNTKKRIVVVGFNNDYELMDIEILREEYLILHIKIPAILNSILLRVRLWSKDLVIYFLKLWLKKNIIFLDGDTVVFNDELLFLDLLDSNWFSKLNLNYSSNLRGVLILRNTIKCESNFHIILSLKEKFEIYSFDPEDCKKLNIKSYMQYCSGLKYLRNKTGGKSEYSLYFLGVDKGRSKYLKKIVELLPNYSSNIKIISRPSNLLEFFLKNCGHKKFNFLPYKTHLDNILCSDVILDIVQDGQSGTTMRSLEAIISGKKIITNNKFIINESYYNQNQIFVIYDFCQLTSTQLCNFIENNIAIKQSRENDFSIISVFKSILGF